MIPALLLILALFSMDEALSAPSAQRDGQTKSQAWFVNPPEAGNAFVHICAVAPTPEEAKEIVWQAHYAHSAWIRYFFRDGSRRKGDPAEPLFRSYGRVNEHCDGTEDLKIYYGVENESVREAKKLYDNPAAFAHLESYDEQTGQGKGFIWIARSPEILFHPYHRLALLIHEMGHAFGHDHIEGTIMDGNIAGILKDSYLQGKPFIPAGPVMTNGEPLAENWIDLHREAVAWSVIRIPAVKEVMQEGSERARALALLVGEKISGPYELRFLDKYTWRDEADNYTDTGKGFFAVLGNSCLNPSVLKDGRWSAPCQWKFKVVYGPVVTLPMGEQELFRRVFRGKIYSEQLNSSMQTGYFLDSSGNKTEFVISRNLGEKLDLSLMVKGEKIRIY
ncbi:MAG: hypothetical protein ACXWQO_04040 [Bdellovibrionota bacterium]